MTTTDRSGAAPDDLEQTTPSRVPAASLPTVLHELADVLAVCEPGHPAGASADSTQLLLAGTYDVRLAGRDVRIIVRCEYEYCLTYSDGTRRYASTGENRQLAESTAASSANWNPPGPPGTIATRTVVELYGPWRGHPHEPGPGDQTGDHRPGGARA